MAEILKDHPKVPRNYKPEVVHFESGYDVTAVDLMKAMAEALQQVPEEYRDVCVVHGPDEDGDAWTLFWYVYESDEHYQKRVRDYEDHVRARTEHVISSWRMARDTVMTAKTIGAKRGALAEMQRLEYTAKEMDVELPE